MKQLSWYTVLFIVILLGTICFSQKINEEVVTPQWPIRPIRIALAIDEHSVKDMHILIHSVMTVAHNKSDLVFHILVCGKDELISRRLKSDVEDKIRICFPQTQFELMAFHLPPDRGFGSQLSSLKQKASHWNSPSGADMARFFLAEAFPSVPRLLYLDNDVILNCCLEEIFDSPLEDKVIGLALDDLKWAVVTQFQRHYNASHPLVIKNIRRHSATTTRPHDNSTPISKEEFAKAVPRYPNDGVLLIDVQRYNRLQVLQSLEEIAAANAEGEYVVGIGTQQFTVLGMFDRWKEITPRANLRHFPDMARGYMMWFYYTGILHYAGAAKPRALCHVDSFKDNNWHRVQSFTPWLMNHYHVNHKCPHWHLSSRTQCDRHLLQAQNLFAFLRAFLMIVDDCGSDRQLLYLRMGPSVSSLTSTSYENELTQTWHALQSLGDIPLSVNSTQLNCSASDSLRVHNIHLLDIVDHIVLHNTDWDVRLLIPPSEQSSQQVDSLLRLLEPFNTSYSSSSSSSSSSTTTTTRSSQLAAPFSGIHRKRNSSPKQSKTRRRMTLNKARWCVNHEPEGRYVAQQTIDKQNACQSVLLDMKGAGYKHWDAVVMSIQMADNRDSLAALKAIDFSFLRPKAILLALRMEDTVAELERQAVEVETVLARVDIEILIRQSNEEFVIPSIAQAIQDSVIDRFHFHLPGGSCQHSDHDHHSQSQSHSHSHSHSHSPPVLPVNDLTYRKQLFTLDPTWRFLNHGAFGSTLRALSFESFLWREYCETQPLRFFDRELFPLIVHSLRVMSQKNILHCQPYHLLPLINVTSGLNAIAQSIPWNPSDEFVTFSLSYGSSKKIFQDHIYRNGGKMKIIPIDLPITSIEDVISSLEREITLKTKAVLLDAITSNTALELPVLEIAKRIKAINSKCIVIIDGAHSLFSQSIQLESLNNEVETDYEKYVDFWLTNGHKWFSAPKGCAVMWTNPSTVHSLRPAIISHGYRATTNNNHNDGMIAMNRTHFLSGFAWDGCRDYSAFLTLPSAVMIWNRLAASWSSKSSYETSNPWQVHREYIHNLLNDAEAVCRELWGIQDHDFASPLSMRENCPMRLIPLPNKVLGRNTRQGCTDVDAFQLQEKLHHDYKVEVPVKCLNGKLYVRISAHIYNILEDYQKLAIVIRNLP
eukprot:gene52-55_t